MSRRAGGSWGRVKKFGTWSWGRRWHPPGHCARWRPGDVSHHPWCSPRARLARSWAVLPGVSIRPCWLPAQPGLAPAPWHHHGGSVAWEGGCRGSIYRCPDASGECWSSSGQLGSAGQCHGPWLGVCLVRHQLAPRLGASLSQHDGARLKASDKLFGGGESCRLPSSAPCREQSAGSGDPSAQGSGQSWQPPGSPGTAGHPLPSALRLPPTLHSFRPAQSAAIIALISCCRGTGRAR